MNWSAWLSALEWLPALRLLGWSVLTGVAALCLARWLGLGKDAARGTLPQTPLQVVLAVAGVILLLETGSSAGGRAAGWPVDWALVLACAAFPGICLTWVARERTSAGRRQRMSGEGETSENADGSRRAA